MMCNLRAIRESLGITQRELAVIFGQTASNISHYENGKQDLPPACARRLILAASERGVDLNFDQIYGAEKVGATATATETAQEAE